MNTDDFTFEGLGGGGQYVTSLAYLVTLIPPTASVFCDEANDRILAAQYDFEEQAKNPSDLLEGEKLHLPPGVMPQTPVMITKGWSPLASVLKRGIEPKFMRRHEKAGRLAVGIWLPRILGQTKEIKKSQTDEDLFWAIFDKVCGKAIRDNLVVCILAQTGWSYEYAVGSLQNWTAKEIEKADRVLWKRTPKG